MIFKKEMRAFSDMLRLGVTFYFLITIVFSYSYTASDLHVVYPSSGRLSERIIAVSWNVK